MKCPKCKKYVSSGEVQVNLDENGLFVKLECCNAEVWIDDTEFAEE